MFQNLDTTVTKFLGDYDITIIEFLNTVLPKYLEDNDISVTKFLNHSVGEFLESNDITVTKFLDENDISVTKFLGENDISVTKFLKTDTAVSNYPFGREHVSPSHDEHHDNEYASHRPRHAHYMPDEERRSYDHRYMPEHSRIQGEWDDDLYYGDRKRHHYEGGEHHRATEHARTVYPHDYPHTPHGDYRFDSPEHIREHDY